MKLFSDHLFNGFWPDIVDLIASFTRNDLCVRVIALVGVVEKPKRECAKIASNIQFLFDQVDCGCGNLVHPKAFVAASVLTVK